MRWLTLLMAGLSVALVPAVLWLAWSNRAVTASTIVSEPEAAFVWVQLLAAVVWIAAGLVMLRRPDLGWSVLCAAAGLVHVLGALSYGWAIRSLVAGHSAPGSNLAVWVLAWSVPVEVIAGNWMMVTVPTGHLPRGRLRPVALFTVGGAVAGVVAAAASALDVAGTDFRGARNPFGGGFPIPPFAPFLLIAPTAITGIVVVWSRWRASIGDTRVAMRRVVVIAIAGLFIPIIVASGSAGSVMVGQAIAALQILALLAVVLRHQLFGIDSFFERALRYTLLSLVLLGLYVSLVALGDLVFEKSIGVLAAVMVALVALPARDWLGRIVARFVYGERDNPQHLVEAVAGVASLAASPEDMLDAVLGQISVGLRLPQVRVCTPDGSTLAETMLWTSSGHGATFELVHRGRLVGVFEVDARSGEDEVSDADRDVLERLASQLATIVDAASMALELRKTRDRVVRVREEERRRLRRDLHDGLGPVLTGAALITDAASNTLRHDPEKADELLNQVRGELSGAIVEIRRLVEDLRPPALDDLGLVAAITQHAQRFPHLAVTVTAECRVAVLPAAVEVATYRIAIEALTNIARHSDASTADVSLRINGNFELQITDSGSGTDPWSHGVGITSMTERAVEIGGELFAGPLPTGGGRVTARLPIEL